MRKLCSSVASPWNWLLIPDSQFSGAWILSLGTFFFCLFFFGFLPHDRNEFLYPDLSVQGQQSYQYLQTLLISALLPNWIDCWTNLCKKQDLSHGQFSRPFYFVQLLEFDRVTRQFQVALCLRCHDTMSLQIVMSTGKLSESLNICIIFQVLLNCGLHTNDIKSIHIYELVSVKLWKFKKRKKKKKKDKCLTSGEMEEVYIPKTTYVWTNPKTHKLYILAGASNDFQLMKYRLPVQNLTKLCTNWSVEGQLVQAKIMDLTCPWVLQLYFIGIRVAGSLHL